MNGYSTWIALVCFALVMQILSILSIETLQQVALVQCAKQNVIDLSCMSHAKEIIRQNQMAIRCGTPHPIKTKTVTIDGIPIQWNDHKTYVECTYPKANRIVTMKIYYDAKAILSMDIDSVLKKR
ncbi:MAG: hypothetical protein SOS22_02100 [Absicoccus sp.]|uniref:hypothetical protein n=1 Tax=Absicoccus sp. TaxID=2718527 RepID=UPI002A75F0B6|nr:hypothetical protein [Absicoccus sp.]MDY3034997.1 hypothetical protein [Absicoccus sp.]